MKRALLLLAVACGLCFAAGAHAAQSIRTSLAVAPYTQTADSSDTVTARKIGTRFSLMEVEPGSIGWVDQVHRKAWGGTAQNTKFLRYDNNTNGNYGSHRDKFIALRNAYRDSLGSRTNKFENFWSHYVRDTYTSNAIAGVPTYRFGEGAPGTWLMYDSAGTFTDITAKDGSVNSNKNGWLGTVNTRICMGDFDPFDAVRCSLSVAGSGTIVAQYYRGNGPTDSTWTTLTLTRDSTQAFATTGWVGFHFIPPADWGYRVLNGQPGFWIRLAQTVGGTRPQFQAIFKGRRYEDVAIGGDGAAFKTGTRIGGWDAQYDLNGDGYIDTTEATDAQLAADSCHVRVRALCRVPYYSLTPARWATNPSDTTFLRLNAQWQVTQTTALNIGGEKQGTALDGIFEDNCFQSDGSVFLGGGPGDAAVSWGLMDSLMVGNSFIPSGYTNPVDATGTFRKANGDPGNGTRGGAIIEFPTRGGDGPTRRAGPGRLFTTWHLKADSVSYKYLVLTNGKLYEGNPSQYFCDSHLQDLQPYHAARYVGDTQTPTWAPLTQTSPSDSGGWFSHGYHSGCQREFFVSTKQSYDNPTSLQAPQSDQTVGMIFARDGQVSGRFLECIPHYSYASWVTNYTRSGTYNGMTFLKNRDKMYTLALALMNQHTNGVSYATGYYAWYDPDATAYPVTSTSIDSASFGAVFVDIGYPLSDSVYTFASGTEPAAAADSSNVPYHVYAKYFSNGIVFLKPLPIGSFGGDSVVFAGVDRSALKFHQTAHTLPDSTHQLVNVDGSLATANGTLKIKNLEGVIYKGTTTLPGASDLTAPVVTSFPSPGLVTGGSTVTLTWAAHDSSTNFSDISGWALGLSTNNGSTYADFDSGTGNPGTRSWVVPNTPSTTCILRLAVYDAHPNRTFATTQVFTIQAGGGGGAGSNPVISFISPSLNCWWKANNSGMTRKVSWNVSLAPNATVSRAVLDFSPDAGSHWAASIVYDFCCTPASAFTTPTGSLDLSTTYANLTQNGLDTTLYALPRSNAVLRLTIYDSNGNASQTTSPIFTLSTADSATTDVTAPTCVVISPNGGERWERNSTHQIQYTATDNVGVTSVNVYYRLKWSDAWVPVVIGALPNGFISWTVPDSLGDILAGNTYGGASIRVRAYDAAGNSAASDSDTCNTAFTITDLTAPAVSFTFPAGGIGNQAQGLYSFQAGDSVNFTIGWADRSGLRALLADYSVDGGATWTRFFTDFDAGDLGQNQSLQSGTFNIPWRIGTATFPATSMGVMRVTLQDASGAANVSTATSATFSIRSPFQVGGFGLRSIRLMIPPEMPVRLIRTPG